MTWLRQFALVVHLLGVSLWLGGALALTRVASAADNERDPNARSALVLASKKLLRAVCEPWMFAAVGAGFALVLLGPSRKTSALIGSRAFWIELASGILLVLMQRALDRRVRRVAKVTVLQPERASAEREDGTDGADGTDGTDGRVDLPEKKQETPVYVAEHAPRLRRIQRVIFALALVALSAAIARR